MTVVLVLITSCQVSEKAKNGPLSAQTSTTPDATRKTPAEPVTPDAHWANLLKISVIVSPWERSLARRQSLLPALP
jgi:hypothetical protein